MEEELDPSDPPERWPLFRLIRVADHFLQQHLADHLRPYQLTPAGFLVLLVLAQGPLTQRELAARAVVEEQTMGRTVNRLSRLGLVKRKRDPTDRRRLLVSRSAVGEETLRLALADDPFMEFVRVMPDLEQLRVSLAAVVRASYRVRAEDERRLQLEKASGNST